MSIIDSIQLSGVTYQIQGEITVDAALDSGSTNPVANSAITTALGDKVNVVDNEVPDYNVTSQITYQGGYPSQSETASTWADATIYTLRYNFVRISDTNYTTTAAVIDPSGNITTGSATVEESIRNPLPDYINMVREDEEFSRKYYFTAKEGYRIAHLDIYSSRFGSYGAIIEERVETVFEGGQSADVIKDVIEPTLINKQDQLVSGTNIKTINNTSILGSGNIDIQGGGKAIEAGRGISITTGETADTVSFNLPIYSGSSTNAIAMNYSGNTASGNYSHAEGTGTTAYGYSSHAEGDNTRAYDSSSHAEGTWTTAGGGAAHAEGSATEAYGDCSHTEGWNTTAYNQSEHASGQYNNSVSASTTFGNSGNTLFSVGNGTSESARHNAFEIRQNGDIYLSSGGTDIKLQDHLGGSVNVVQTTGTSTTDVMSQNAATSNFIYHINLNYKLNGRNTLALQSKGKNLFIPYMTINGEKVLSTNDLSVIETSAITTSISSSSTDAQVPSAKAVYDAIQEGGGSSYSAGDGIDITNDVISVTGMVDTSTYNTYTAATDTALASKADTSAVTEVSDALTAHTANTTVHTTAAEKTSWNGAVTDIATVSGQVSTNTTNIATVSAATTANTTALGGLSLIKLTQAQYDALVTKDNSTLYVIVD